MYTEVEHQQKVRELFDAALKYEPEQRSLFLAKACSGNEVLFKDVESLITDYEKCKTAREQPIVQDVVDTKSETIYISTVLPSAKLPSIAEELVPGKRINHYEIIALIGRGGMGQVYLAQDTRLLRKVAIKLLSTSAHNSDLSRRFFTEAQMASALNHPNIITVYDIGEMKESRYMVMEFVDGQIIRELLKQKQPLKFLLSIGAQIASALSAAHKADIVHRDIKPENIMVRHDGYVKVLDFGIARLATKEVEKIVPGEVTITSLGRLVGTPGYMSPEQTQARNVSSATDIFSFGIVLYELITGQHPFNDGSGNILQAISSREALSPQHLNKEIPPTLDSLIMLMLDKDPYRRPTAREVEAVFNDMLGNTVAAREASLPYRFKSESLRESFDYNVVAAIAVLPFTNLSDDKENEYFSDGLTEDIISLLSQLQNLRVVSRTSVFDLKHKAKSIAQIGEQLNVQLILEGSVRRAGNKLRINVQLVNVADGYHIWSQRFDRDMTDIFEIQDEIASTVADMLAIKITKKEFKGAAKMYTNNVEAYNLYLRGRYHWNKPNDQGFKRAAEYFEQALEKDANYAPAYAGLADYYCCMALWGVEPAQNLIPKAKTMALKALELDPALAEPYVSLASIKLFYEWNMVEAEKQIFHALKLNASYAYAYSLHVMCLISMGKLEEAKVQAKRASLVDPISLAISRLLPGVYYYMGEHDHSIKECAKGLELDPQDIELNLLLAINYEQKGMFAEALAIVEHMQNVYTDHPIILGTWGEISAQTSNKDKALELLKQLTTLADQRHIPAIMVSRIYLALGDKDRAFEWLYKAVEFQDSLLIYLKVDPFYRALKTDTRYEAILEKMLLSV